MDQSGRGPQLGGRKRRAFALLAVGLTLAVAGCGGTPRRTMTGSEAIQHIDGYLKGAVDAAPTSLRMVRKEEADDAGGCSKSGFHDDFTGQVNVHVTYESSKVTPEVATQYLDAVASLWEQQYGPVDRSEGHIGARIDDGRFTLYGNTRPGPGTVAVSGVSECIWVNGTPGPDDNP